MSSLTLDQVKSLVEKSSHDSGIIPQLEAYVQATAFGSADYCFDANKCLVKLYNFSPHLAKEEVYSLILFLALLEFPSTDLVALSCLVPIKFSEPAIIKCADLLDACKFAEFWTAFEALKSSNNNTKSLASAPATTTKLHQSILSCLALTYRTAPVALVTAALNVSSVDEIKASSCVEAVDANTVTFYASANNTKRNRVFQQGVGFSDISTMMNTSSATVPSQ